MSNKIFDIIFQKAVQENFLDREWNYSVENKVFQLSDFADKGSSEINVITLTDSIIVLKELYVFGIIADISTDLESSFISVRQKNVIEKDFKEGMKVKNETGTYYSISNCQPVILKDAFEIYYDSGDFIFSDIKAIWIEYLNLAKK